jgi:hypothetical protein
VHHKSMWCCFVGLQLEAGVAVAHTGLEVVACSQAAKCHDEFERLRRTYGQHPYLLWYQQAPSALEQLIAKGNTADSSMSSAGSPTAGRGAGLLGRKHSRIVSDPELAMLTEAPAGTQTTSS